MVLKLWSKDPNLEEMLFETFKKLCSDLLKAK